MRIPIGGGGGKGGYEASYWWGEGGVRLSYWSSFYIDACLLPVRACLGTQCIFRWAVHCTVVQPVRYVQRISCLHACTAESVKQAENKPYKRH